MALAGGERDEPTPWATGLTVAAIMGVLVFVIDLLLARSLAASFGWVWIPANLLMTAGLAPSFLLLRRQRTWRWVAYGVAAGLGVAWFALLVGLAFAGPKG